MHGFIAVISLEKPLPSISFNWKPLFSFQKSHAKRKIQYANLQIEQFTSEQFLPDKYWIDTDEFIFITEGLITNVDDLLYKHKAKNVPALISQLSENKEDFFKDFRGNFVGFFYDKQNNSYIAFNNHTATKRLFYFKHTEYLIFSTDLYTLSKTLSSLQLNKSLDIEAAYLLLTNGFMQDDYTLIKEAKQLRAGEYAVYKDNNLYLNFYFHLKDIKTTTDNEIEIIENLDALFLKAVQTEFEFEKQRGYAPITTLSAGLDSRMVSLTAHKLGYSNQTIFNFSSQGFADEVIAKNIAHAYNMKVEFRPLTPYGLAAIDEVVKLSDGLNIYSGISHAFEAISKTDFSNPGLIHTGINGDAVLGSFYKDRTDNTIKLTHGLCSSKLLSRIHAVIEKNILSSGDLKSYEFYNRAFSGTNVGFLCFNLISETFSPFLHPDFFQYALSIPQHLQFKQYIYIKWIQNKHPEYARYVWEGIGGKPTTSNLMRFWYRGKRAIIKRLPFRTMWTNNMNPEQLWYDTNPDVKQQLDQYLEVNISKFEFNKELMNDMYMLYTTGNIVEKAQVLTLLGAYKLLFE